MSNRQDDDRDIDRMLEGLPVLPPDRRFQARVLAAAACTPQSRRPSFLHDLDIKPLFQGFATAVLISVLLTFLIFQPMMNASGADATEVAAAELDLASAWLGESNGLVLADAGDATP